MTASECAKETYRVNSLSPSAWAEFHKSHMGHEFYDKRSNQVVQKWMIHNSFTEEEIKEIVYNKHPRYGYRIKSNDE
jgi:hypothetical protein